MINQEAEHKKLREMLHAESNAIRIAMGKKPETVAEQKQRAKITSAKTIASHFGISIHDVYPEKITTEIVETDESFLFANQKDKVDIEKHMISDETNIPASISNKLGKLKDKVKELFHKAAPTAITLTKRNEIENRTLGDTYKQYGGAAVIGGIVLIYLLTRGK